MDKRTECIVEFLRTPQKCLEKILPQASTPRTDRMLESGAVKNKGHFRVEIQRTTKNLISADKIKVGTSRVE